MFNDVQLERKIFVREDLEFAELESFNENNKRYYKTPTGENYPSVTTVLGSSLDKSKLFEWRKRVGEQEAQKISTRAANRGTLLHSMCEKYMLNDDSFAQKQMPLTIELFKSIQKYIDAVEVVYGNEIPLYSHDLKTAGRSDVFCKMGGKNCILDFKTSSRLKTEKDIESYFLQCTAYAMMIRELKQIEVPRIVILIAVEGEKSQYFIKSTSQYEERVRSIFYNYHR